MAYRTHLARLLVGSNRRASLLTVGIGILFGVGAWLGYPILGVSYWLLPSSLIDWAFVFSFIFLAAGVAFDRAGFLAAWWVNHPAHIAISHYYFTFHGTLVVLPFESDFLSYLVISAPITCMYGILGYLIGRASRWTLDRSGFSGRSEVKT